MSTYCYCDNCLSYGKRQLELDKCPTAKTLDQMLAEEMQQQLQHVPQAPVCPGYSTAIVTEECGAPLPYGQTICPTCVKRRHQQEIIEDELVEQYLQRQLDLEEAQMLAFEDVESDEDTREGDIQMDVQKRAYRLLKL
ncbi:MAG: hypothetical protein VXZ72_00140 [Chlamydiota bacterium]|nr:hypothetical protein [Chlamydiota bacterium]